MINIQELKFKDLRLKGLTEYTQVAGPGVSEAGEAHGMQNLRRHLHDPGSECLLKFAP